MHRIIILLSLLIIMGSCYNHVRPPSFDMSLVIPADSMISLLTDLHLAEGMINIEQKKEKPLDHISGEYFHTVMQRHDITIASFEESIRYYVYNTEEFNKIYEQVIIRLSTIESTVLKK